MALKSIQFIGLSIEDLQGFIKEAVASEIERAREIFATPNPEEKDLLTREEAKDFLKVSYTSLWSYGKKKLITPKSLGGRVYYLKSELLNLINNDAA